MGVITIITEAKSCVLNKSHGSRRQYMHCGCRGAFLFIMPYISLYLFHRVLYIYITCIKKNVKTNLKGRHGLMSFAFDFDKLGIRQRKKCSSKSLYIADEVIAGIEEIASMTNSSFNNVATSMLETQLKILQQRYKKE